MNIRSLVLDFLSWILGYRRCEVCEDLTPPDMMKGKRCLYCQEYGDDVVWARLSELSSSSPSPQNAEDRSQSATRQT